MASSHQSCKYGFQKGVALILVNKNFPKTGSPTRLGADEDYRCLQECFQDMGFHVDPHFDQTGLQMVRHVKRVAAMNHATNACVVVAISSHGNQYENRKHQNTDSVTGTDGQIVSFFSITRYFQEQRCPTLKGKPKLFFIQCCRGYGLSETATAQEEVSKSSPKSKEQGGGDFDRVDDDAEDMDADDIDWRFPKCFSKRSSKRSKIIYSDDIPLHRDFLLSCSSAPGFSSFHRNSGSWFILELCKVLAEKHKDCDLLTMLSEVNWRVATEYESRKQSDPAFHERHLMPWVASMLTKDLYL